MTATPESQSPDQNQLELLNICSLGPVAVDKGSEPRWRPLETAGWVTLVPVTGAMIQRNAVPDHWKASLTDAGREQLTR